jgi:galactokinase
MTLLETATSAYKRAFDSAPAAAAIAPGRVEIMGNHTDYNGGFVLPAALDRATCVAGERLDGSEIILHSADFARTVAVDGSRLERIDGPQSWANYLLGVVDQLRKAGVAVGGFRAVLHSTVPTGAGLSSSAAIEAATALFLRALFPYAMDTMDIARLCQRAENQFVGVNCGILDQFSSLFGREGSLLFLDCMTLEHDAVKMGRDDIAIVICDSRVKHALTGGDYNTRRAECMAAAAHFGKSLLREVDWAEFEAREGELPENQRRRARHVLTEDQRVLAMHQAIQSTDTAPIGRLLAEGHASCRDLFENSTPEIDFLVDTAVAIDGCIGAKLTGGGWGGCTVNLVHAGAVDAFAAELAARYQDRHNKDAHIYACRVSAGAREVAV